MEIIIETNRSRRGVEWKSIGKLRVVGCQYGSEWRRHAYFLHMHSYTLQ